jgi:iron complex transport system permease protein
MIFFIGLLAPHVIRLACGPAHRVVLPGAMLLGGALVVAADTVGRTAVAPAELPLGVFTAFIGAPFFVLLLLRERRAWSL